MKDVHDQQMFLYAITALYGLYMFALIQWLKRKERFPFREGRIGYWRPKFERFEHKTGWPQLDALNSQILWLDSRLYFVGSRSRIKAILMGLPLERQINGLRCLRLGLLTQRRAARIAASSWGHASIGEQLNAKP